MMKLSLMQKVVDTVNEEWRSPLAEMILSRWGFDNGEVYYFRASSNFVFIFRKDGKTRYLRFNHSSERDLRSIESETEILLYLQNQPIRVAQLVKSIEGRYIEEVETELGKFYAVVFEALPGEHFETEELNEGQFVTWGRELGKLHRILKTIPDEIRLKRPSWKEQLQRLKAILPEEETTALKEVEYVLSWASSIPETNDNFGLIHFDFELDNLRWDDEAIGILDFDDSANYWYAADIAYALRDVLEEGSFDPNHPSLTAFLKGYASETELDRNLIEDLPGFLRLHQIISFTKLHQSVDITDSPEHPEWLEQLRIKLIGKIGSYRKLFATYKVER
jgi:Ser/Thr protein kinase RdoA (MazF antagonist)